MRSIYCEACVDKHKLTLLEDIVMGRIPRRTWGSAQRRFTCDGCGATIEHGEHCQAHSIPNDMFDWEKEYLDDV